MANMYMIHISKSIRLALRGIVHATILCTQLSSLPVATSHPFVQFKTPGSFAPVWTISQHRLGTGKNVTVQPMGLMVQTFPWNVWINSNLATICMIIFSDFFCNEKKHAQQPFSKPHCFVNVENNSTGYPWYDYGGSFSPSLVTLYGFEALKPLVLATNLNIYMNIYIIYKLYIYIYIYMIQSTHNQNTFLTNGHPTW